MRRGGAVAVAAMMWVGAAWGAAWGQELTKDEKEEKEWIEVRVGINALMKLARDGSFKAVADGALAIKKSAESARDFHALETLYHLQAVAAEQLNDKRLAENAELQNAILRARVHGADDLLTVDADINVALTATEYNKNRRIQIAATNALGGIALLRMQGEGSTKLDRQEAVAHFLLGENYRRTEQFERALFHLEFAREHGRGGLLPERSMAEVEVSITMLAAKVEKARTAHVAGACTNARRLSVEIRDACLKRSRLARLDKDPSLAETILRELIVGVEENNLGEERLPAAFELHLLLVTQRAPNDPEVVRSVLRLGNRLAVDDFLPAALLTMRTAAALLHNGVANKAIADLCGHIARRAARGGDEDVALRFLDVQLATLDKGRALAGDASDAVDLAIEQTLVQLEAASFADLNGYEGLAAAYREEAETRMDAFPAMDFYFDLVLDKLGPYKEPSRGFVFPGPGAAAELAGRTAFRTEFAALGRSTAIQKWIDSELNFRGNKVGALALSARLIEETRKDASGGYSLANLLSWRARHADDPSEKSRLLRESYELYTRIEREMDNVKTLLNDIQNIRVGVLLDLADLSASINDSQTQHGLIDEVHRIVSLNDEINEFYLSQLKIFSANLAMRAGDITSATTIAEDALNLVARRIGPASIHAGQILTELYIRSGRKEEARTVYKKYVLDASDALVIGEAAVIDNQLGIAALEARFDPTTETLKEIEAISRLANQRASRDAGLRQSILRAEAFARYGIGQGLPALRVGRQAMAMTQNYNNEKVAEKEDRPLLETIVGAAVMAAAQIEGGPAPR